ncbi:MAG: hypothetical protein A3I63_05460 [Betaproteobacteria bacterium RIFCSPLOWO2_02_FULL_66_14]|nr:MAG: hypothetical protein A3I63_05460 [Betaproteobacteria bacterium RIFCSPLOWO2_02_FULL_66_14]
MERVGIYEAKAKLSDLVDRAAQGMEVTITRHGKAVAKLVPARSRAAPGRAKVFDEIDAFARTVKARRFNLRKVIESGRG